MFSEVVTVTVSPGANWVNGRKLAPRPSESPRNVPLWFPLLDPTTVTVPICVIGTPRKTIWLWGDATRLPGMGNTYTCGPARGAPGAGRANANTPIAVSTHASISDLSAGR